MLIPRTQPRPRRPYFAWFCTLVLAVAVAVRLCWYDANYVLIWINAFTRYLYLPAWGCLAWATWRRRWVLAAVNVVIVGFHVAWLAPDFYPAARPEFAATADTADSAADPVSFRLFYANLHASNHDCEALFKKIGDAKPDVVVLVEFVGHWPAAAAESPVMSAFPHQVVSTPPGGEVMTVFAKFPLQRIPLTGRLRHRLLLADCAIADRQLRLFCLHAPRPMHWPWWTYHQYWREVELALADQPEPLLVLGDFNTTQYSRVYGRLTAQQLRGAHEDRGRGYAVTWPNYGFFVPLIRIDHILMSPGVECLEIAEGENPGSDHRSLIVDLRIHESGTENEQLDAP